MPFSLPMCSIFLPNVFRYIITKEIQRMPSYTSWALNFKKFELYLQHYNLFGIRNLYFLYPVNFFLFFVSYDLMQMFVENEVVSSGFSAALVPILFGIYNPFYVIGFASMVGGSFYCLNNVVNKYQNYLIEK